MEHLNTMPIKRNLINSLLLCGVVIAVFGNTLLNGFVWDDNLLIIDSPFLKEFMPGTYFFSFVHGVEYCPLSTLSLAIDYAIWGEHAFGFHLTNLLIYLATVLVVYYLVLRILALYDPNNKSGNTLTSVALMTALMYAVHPMHSEAVAWICDRGLLLSTLFSFISCSFYLAWLREERKTVSTVYLASLLFFICSLLSKATSITMPVVFLLLMVCDSRKKSLRALSMLVPYVASSFIFYLIFTRAGVNAGRIEHFSSSFGSSPYSVKAATALQIPLFYFKKLFIPFGLSPEYDKPFKTSLADPAVLYALAVLLVLVYGVLAVRKRHAGLVLGFGWFFITLAPVLNFFSTHPVVADRYVYLPSFGLFFFIAVFLSIRGQKLLLVCSVLLCFWWSFTAFSQNRIWKSDITLWGHALDISPRSLQSYINLGTAYYQEGNDDKAIATFTVMESHLPQDDYLSLYKGNILLKKGDLKGALAELNKAYSRNDEFPRVLYALGTTYEQLGDSYEAIKMYSAVVQHTQGYYAIKLGEPSRKAIGRLLIKFGPELDSIRKKVSSKPDDLNIRGELALKLDRLCQYEEALGNYLEMERRGMKSWQLFFNIANIYKKTKNDKEAVKYYEKCLNLNPSYSDAANNLGTVLRKMRQYDRAISVFERIIAANSQFGYAPYNLASLYNEKGDRANALRYFQYTYDRFPQLREKTAPHLKLLQQQYNN